MKKDYDLIIIGNTKEAIFAAQLAIKFRARIALIIPTKYPDFYNQEIDFKLLKNLDLSLTNNYNLELFSQQIYINYLQENYQKLALRGVDIIYGQPEFISYSKREWIIINDRKLTAINYLIATSNKTIIYQIKNLEKQDSLSLLNINYLTKNLLKMPENIIIMGEGIKAIFLAQNFNKLGKKVTLVTAKKQILPDQDEDLSFFIQGILESEGIIIFTNKIVREIEQKKLTQVENFSFQNDGVLLIKTENIANINGLNLENMGIKFDKNGIIVNNKLQTNNPHIYACGNVIGGYNAINIAQYEAEIAVKNALFFNRLDVDYLCKPYQILTSNITITRVGLTESDARKFYDDKIEVIKCDFSQLFSTIINSNDYRFMKIILLPNGLILGGHFVGKNMGEFCSLIALAMEKKIKLNNIKKYLDYSFENEEIVNHLISKWNQQKLNQNKIIISLLETFSIWRRS